MNAIWHDHVTTKRGAEILNAPSSIGFESSLRLPQIRNRLAIPSAKRDKVNWIGRKDYLQTLGAAFDHSCVVARFLRAGETPATTTNELFCGGSSPRLLDSASQARRTGIAATKCWLQLFPGQIFFDLGFAFVQRLQTQLPAMQLDRELINITGYFRSLRFVFLQFAAQFLGISMRV